MEKKPQIELRSQDVRDILEHIPNWMIRWGNTLLLLIVLMFFFLSWVVKYPDVIISEAHITTEPSLQKILANQRGRIQHLLVAENQKVKKNTILAILENPANYEDVLQLKKMLKEVKLDSLGFQFPMHRIPYLFLGEIEKDFALFESSYIKYLSNKDLGQFSSVVQNFDLLKYSIENWELKNLLKSEIEGIVYFNKILTKNQIVGVNEMIFTVVPQNVSKYVAKVRASAFNFGKIKKGQRVNLRLESFPDSEFGILVGKINTVSQLPDSEGFYLLEVYLPTHLKTNYGKDIHFKYEMKASAEIITDDLRLIERFFYRLKESWKR